MQTAVRSMFDITDFQTLLDRLDHRNRVLVLSVTLDGEGREHPELWIAPVKELHKRLETVSDDLLGKAILSDHIKRGPDPNSWSHYKRLAANKKMVETEEYRAAKFIRRNLLVNKTVAMVTAVVVVILLAYAAPALLSRISWPGSDDGQDEFRLITPEGERIRELCYPVGSPACEKQQDN
jgi:hypothetical protein